MYSGAFLQSEEWGAFQKSIGRDVVRIEGVGQFLIHHLPFGQKYAFCPRGPVTDVSLDQLRSVADQLSVLFLRLEPNEQRPTSNSSFQKTIDISPPHTLITNLTQTEDQLLATMHEKTRYNIRLALRKGVEIEIHRDFPAIGRDPANGGGSPVQAGATEVALNSVWSLFEQTAKRGQFHLHPKWYYKTMLESGVAFLAVARFDGAVVAANIMIDDGTTRTYLHGASSDKHRQVMGPYLLHWELMKDAKQQGQTAYDWWGIAPEDANEKHPWSGITRFKLGFGGQRRNYPGTFDFVAHPLRYQLYQLSRTINRFLRP